MRTVTAKTPAGGEWAVRVVWQPRWRALARRWGGWRRRRRGGDSGSWGVPDISGGEEFVVVAAVVIGLIVFGLLFWWVLLPLLLLVVDLLIVLILLLLAIPARVLLRRPWTVEAVRAETGERRTAEVVGWRNALRTRDEMAERVRLGL